MSSMLKNKQILAICLFIAAGALIAFQQVNRCDFINYDDPLYVTDNIHVKSGITIGSIRSAFTTGYASNWHPVTWMSHMLDVQLFGLKPQWHHLTNLLFHHCKFTVALFRFSPDDQSTLEERFRGGFVCPSPSPCGIRRLGG